MMTVTSSFKNALLATLCAALTFTGKAQNLPVCSGTGVDISSGTGSHNGTLGLIYALSTSGTIYKIDPKTSSTPVPTSITVPSGARGLAVSRNLNGGTVTPTYYTIVQTGSVKYLYYFNGTSWTSTTFVLNVDNIAAGGGFIYGLDCASGNVFRSNATSIPTYLGNVGTVGSCDLSVDCSGNITIISQGDSSIRRYFYSGTTLNQTKKDTMAGAYALGGGGFAILGNGSRYYYDGADGKLYQGVPVSIGGGRQRIVFTAMPGTPFGSSGIPIDDFGNCGENGVGPGIYATDSVRLCQSGTGNTQNVSLTIPAGSGTPNWRVQSGPAVLTGATNTSVTVTNLSALTPSVILHNDPDCGGANTLIDTTVIAIAGATVDAGPDKTLFGCGNYQDTLHATVKDTSIGIGYSPTWTPFSTILNPTQFSYDPVIYPTKTTVYVLDVATLGGCHFYDSVKVTVIDSTPRANFQYQIKLGCEEDTVQFFNTSTPINGIDSVAWDFADSAGNNNMYYYSNAISPRHIFKDQGIYSVLLLVKNKYCFDTIRKNINILHPLVAAFSISDSTACSNKLITFTDNSVAPLPPPNGTKTTFLYKFGDGTTSSLSNTTHNYTRSGIYTATLTLQNYLGCRDSFKRTIVIDSLPFVRILSADTVVCQGQKVNLKADYLTIGNTGISVSLGDGTVFQNRPEISYAFVDSGVYNVTLNATYRYCPPASVTVPFRVRPFPGVYLGPDTVLCPYGAPVVLSDRANIGRTDAQYLWSTGETTPAITARNIGTYWARVNVGGCLATDSIVVNKDCFLDIPNAFTPNNDGQNDYFLPRQIKGRSISLFKMKIFDRWGQEVFETVRTDGRGWDGKFNGIDQPTGVYIFQVDVSFENGASEHYTGNVTLLR